MDLDDILEVISVTTGADLAPAIQAAVRSAADNGADMVGLEQNAVTRFRELQAQLEDTGNLSEEQLGALEALVDVVETLREYNVQALAAEEAARERLALLSGRVEATTQAAAESEDEDDENDENEGDGAGEEGGEGAGATETAPETQEQQPEAVAASAKLPARKPSIPLGLMRTKPGAPGARRASSFGVADDRTIRYTVSAADVPGFSSRQSITDIDQLGMLVKTRMQGLVRSANSARAGIATITRHVNTKFVVNAEMDLDRVVEFVTDEKNLAGGSLIASVTNSLTAAGGVDLPRAVWCAPMETLWDICADPSGDDGFLDLPTVTTKRAGVRYPAGFDFSALYGGLGFYQAINGVGVPQISPTPANIGELGTDKKCCVDIPCPTWTDAQVELLGLCIRNKILLERAWPEWTREFTAAVLKAHRRKVNAWLIAKVEALAGAAQTFAITKTGTPPNIYDGTHGPGGTESLLSIVELVVENYRYRYRLGRTQTLEMIAPFWLLGLLRADLSKKVGNSPNRLMISDGEIIRYLAARGVRVQFVYDWQDAFAASMASSYCVPGADPAVPTITPTANAFGNPAGLKEWPTSVKLLLYPAGSVFKLQQDIITLDGIYDHASLMENKYTSLFTEEGVNAAVRCFSPTLISITGLCPDGQSGGMGYGTCLPPVVTPLVPEGITSGSGSGSPSLAAPSGKSGK